MQTEDWRDWRLEHDGLIWRVALQKDEPGIAGVLDAVDNRLGKQDRPDLYAAPVLLTLVAEDETGAIVDGLYIELVAEIVKFSDNRRAFDSYEKLLPYIGSFLQSREVRVVQMNVLSRWERVMSGSLERMGFGPIAPKFKTWMRKVRK